MNQYVKNFMKLYLIYFGVITIAYEGYNIYQKIALKREVKANKKIYLSKGNYIQNGCVFDEFGNKIGVVINVKCKEA